MIVQYHCVSFWPEIETKIKILASQKKGLSILTLRLLSDIFVCIVAKEFLH